MVKSVFIYCFVFLGLFFLSYTFHEKYIEENEVLLSFSLQKIYLFHLGFSLLICVNFKILSTVDNIYNQLGFIYFAVFAIKIILFFVIFYESVFAVDELTNIARISLVIPMVLFLLTEVFFIAKILNQDAIK